MPSMYRLLCAALSLACASGDETVPGDRATTAALTAQLSLTSPELPVVGAVPTASARPATPPSAWFGPLPAEVPALAQTHRYAAPGLFDAHIGVPDRWQHQGIVNGMSGNTQGMYARPVDRSMIVIVVDHASVHESLLEYGADAWLQLTNDAHVKEWSAPVKVTVGSRENAYTMRRGSGTIGRKQAELVMLRRRFPSLETGPRTLMLVGAIGEDAGVEKRAEYQACLASFTDTELK